MWSLGESYRMVTLVLLLHFGICFLCFLQASTPAPKSYRHKGSVGQFRWCQGPLFLFKCIKHPRVYAHPHIKSADSSALLSILNLCHMVAWLSCNDWGIRQVLTNVSVIRNKWSNVCKECRFAAVDCFIIAPASVFMPEHGPRILSFFFFLLHYSASFVSITRVHTRANIFSRQNHTLSQEESSDG